jgi:hypothetical protein
MAASAAKADDVTIQEIKDLKARLRTLEKRIDSQAKVTQQVVRQQAAYGGPSGPYSPPLPWDKKFHLNGITITPGGFLAAEGIWRSRDTGGNFSPAFGSIPAYNTAGSHMNELRGTAQQSRLSLLVEGAINPSTVVSGYGEFDFLGSGDTANSTESNSYNLRVRHLYATVDWNDIGVHVLGGQTWSLATLSNKGITPRNEDIPLTIDGQYVAGFTWARQAQIRLVKNFGDTFWMAVSAESPQTIGCATGNATGAAPGVVHVPGFGTEICGQTPSGGTGVLNTQQIYSFNHIPDVIAKAAWEPTLMDRKIHVEAWGLYTDLYNEIYGGAPAGATSTRYNTTGWGAGGSVIVQAMPKLVDLQGTGVIGRGIGRYGSSQLITTGLNPNGSLQPLPEIMFMGGAIVHATPQLDVYAYGGEERILNVDYQGVAALGTFNPATSSNAGCYNITGACTNPTEAAWEVTGGFWDKVYEGSFGSVRVGMQYAYVEKQIFEGFGTAASRSLGSPWFNDQEVFTSLRYYPFDPAPAAPLVSKY